MAILFSKEILQTLDKELKEAKESVQIISAYCKLDSIKYLISLVGESVQEKKLLVRFRLEDVLKKSTDFEVLEYCMEQGWKVYIRFDLHVKTYIVDNKRGIVGSANATKSGLTGNQGNYEMAALMPLEEADIPKIEKIYKDAILVDNQILNNLKKQYKSCEKGKSTTSQQWNDEIMKLFHPHIEALFSHELPEKDTFKSGDFLAFLDEEYDGNIEILKEKFRWSNAYLWLLETLRQNQGELYFGSISAKLHDAIVSDPKPYRKDVKQLLANLLSMIENLDMSEVVIDRPKHSQRVRLRKKSF